MRGFKTSKWVNFKQQLSSLRILDLVKDAGASKNTFKIGKNFVSSLLLLSIELLYIAYTGETR